MKNGEYIAKVLQFDKLESDIVTVLINNVKLKCYSFNLDTDNVRANDSWIVQLHILDFDLDSLKQLNNNCKGVTYIDNGLSCIVKGKYNAESQSIDLGFVLYLDSDLLCDFSYLDNKNIEIEILRFDIDFIRKVL